MRLRGGPIHRPPALQPRLRRLTFRPVRLRLLTFRWARLRRPRLHRPGLRRPGLRGPGLCWARLGRAGGSCSRLVTQLACRTRLAGQLVAYAGVLCQGGDLGGAGGQLLGAAVDVVERAAARPGQGFDDLRVVVDRVECPAQECHQLLQPYPELRLRVHPVDVQLDALQVDPYAGVELEQVGQPGAQRDVGVQPVDDQSDRVDRHLRDVEQDVRVAGVDVPVRIPLLRVLAHTLPPPYADPVVRAVRRGYPLSGGASRP
ncbi:hypothetical protein B0E54_02095 [Micromonospora sp. MH99]|nr:hypothetical protein [Micromonospora sp. MH99]